MSVHQNVSFTHSYKHIVSVFVRVYLQVCTVMHFLSTGRGTDNKNDNLCFHNAPQVQVDCADVRNELLRLEVKLAEVFDLKGAHLRTHQVLQEVVEHGDDPFSQEGVHEDALDFWEGGNPE